MIDLFLDSHVEALRSTYTSLLGKAKVLPPELVNLLNCPFLIHPKQSWPDAALRVLLVGQEPFDWGFNVQNSKDIWKGPAIWSLEEFINGDVEQLSDGAFEGPVERMMRAYYWHTYILKSSSGSPFTRAFKFFQEPDEAGRSIEVAYTNIFRCSLDSEGPVNKRSPLHHAGKDNLDRINEWQQGILAREIEILRPNAVIFFSGHHYDSAISREFTGVAFEPVGDRSPYHMARLVHPLLPARSFRTYHPGYLARGKWPWLGELRTLIRES